MFGPAAAGMFNLMSVVCGSDSDAQKPIETNCSGHARRCVPRKQWVAPGSCTVDRATVLSGFKLWQGGSGRAYDRTCTVIGEQLQQAGIGCTTIQNDRRAHALA